MKENPLVETYLAGLAEAGMGFWHLGPVAGNASRAIILPLSIAVLPFGVLGGAADSHFLADGITEDLITRLSRISGAVVIGRSTMFTYRGRAVDARFVGRDLGVRYVVVGTVQCRAERIRINAELVEAAGGAQQWAEEIEYPLNDWLSVSDVVSGRIARVLNLELMNAEIRRTADTPAFAPGAAELAMRGWVELFVKPQTRTSNAVAERWLKEALALDPGLPMGWTGLAYVTYRAASFEWGKGTMDEELSQAVDYAQRAINIDPYATDAYYAMGQSLNAVDELERAQVAQERCIELNPSHAPAYAALGQIRMFLGYPEETSNLCARAFLLSPREPLRAIWLRTRALASLFLGDADASAADAQAAIAINPEYPSAYVILAAAQVRRGRNGAAAATVARLATFSSHGSIAAVRRTHARPRRSRYSVFLDTVLLDLRTVGLPD